MPIHAFQSIESMSEFDHALRSKDLILGYFYKKTPKLKKMDPNLNILHKSINAILKQADGQRYTPEFENVYFIKANVSRPHLEEISRRYPLQRSNEIILFDNGKRVATLRNIRADRISINSLQAFIRENLGKQIKEKAKRRREEEKRREEQRRIRAEERRDWYERYGSPYFYRGWGYPYGHWGYPYWGYYPYHHGSHFGVGFSFH
jgi:hypothetical protein